MFFRGKVIGMPDSGINPDQLTLRDHLARDRTVLANERTFLAYIRTSLALLASGAAVLKFFADDPRLQRLGLALLVIGVGVALLGAWRFGIVARRLHHERIQAAADKDNRAG